MPVEINLRSYIFRSILYRIKFVLNLSIINNNIIVMNKFTLQ